MAEILDINQQLMQKQSNSLHGSFHEWLGGDDFYSMKALVWVISCDVYDCGGPTRKVAPDVTHLGGYEINADVWMYDMYSGRQPLNLHFHTESKRERDAAAKKMQAGSVLVVKGNYCFLVDDTPPSVTIFLANLDAITPVPAGYCAMVREWLSGSGV